jgi:hypothetical protein
MNKFQLFDKPESLYSLDKCGFPLNNRPPKIISNKGKRKVVSLTNVERGENVTIVACCNASGMYILPMVIFKRLRKRPEFEDGCLLGSAVELSDWGYVNEVLFLWLRHLRNTKHQYSFTNSE